MTYPAIHGSSQVVGTATTSAGITVSGRPSGALTGDTLIAGVAARGNITVPTPTGWTLVGSWSVDAQTPGTTFQTKPVIWVFKIAVLGSGDVGPWTFTNADSAVLVATAAATVDGAFVHGANNFSTSNLPVPAVTTTAAQERYLVFGSQLNNITGMSGSTLTTLQSANSSVTSSYAGYVDIATAQSYAGGNMTQTPSTFVVTGGVALNAVAQVTVTAAVTSGVITDSNGDGTPDTATVNLTSTETLASGGTLSTHAWTETSGDGGTFDNAANLTAVYTAVKKSGQLAFRRTVTQTDTTSGQANITYTIPAYAAAVDRRVWNGTAWTALV